MHFFTKKLYLACKFLLKDTSLSTGKVSAEENFLGAFQAPKIRSLETNPHF